MPKISVMPSAYRQSKRYCPSLGEGTNKGGCILSVLFVNNVNVIIPPQSLPQDGWFRKQWRDSVATLLL